MKLLYWCTCCKQHLLDVSASGTSVDNDATTSTQYRISMYIIVTGKSSKRQCRTASNRLVLD